MSVILTIGSYDFEVECNAQFESAAPDRGVVCVDLEVVRVASFRHCGDERWRGCSRWAKDPLPADVMDAMTTLVSELAEASKAVKQSLVDLCAKELEAECPAY